MNKKLLFVTVQFRGRCKTVGFYCIGNQIPKSEIDDIARSLGCGNYETYSFY